MKTVYKFALPIQDEIVIVMPAAAEILTVQVQHSVVVLWALVSKVAPTTMRHFRLAGTGHPVPDDTGKYIGTFQCLGGDLVFHLFDQGEK